MISGAVFEQFNSKCFEFFLVSKHCVDSDSFLVVKIRSETFFVRYKNLRILTVIVIIRADKKTTINELALRKFIHLFTKKNPPITMGNRLRGLTPV